MRESLCLKRKAKDKLFGGREVQIPFLQGVDNKGALKRILRSFDNAADRGFGLKLWISDIKKIEGKFGSGVGTYFRFARFLFALNIFTFLI